MTLTGTTAGSTLSNSSGSYTFAGLTAGGNYTVTPSKAGLTPGAAGINTIDVVATQRHFLTVGTPLSACRLTAANVNGDGSINTTDIVAIQRFALGFSTGIANVGKYQFTPVNRSYTGIATNQTNQNYDVLILGDVASSFVHRPGAPGGDAPETKSNDDEVAVRVEAVALPNGATDSAVTDFVAPVTTTYINESDNLVGFQGDFTFDERLITFLDPAVQNAGLTASEWDVSANVLPGTGPIRTLRVSAYSLDFRPLSGAGTLFQLRIRKEGVGERVTQLLWALPPDDFIFIDADLNPHKPDYTGPGSVR